MSVFSIPLTGLASNDPLPGNYLEVDFAQGPASSGQDTYAIMILANMLSTGAAGLDGYVYGPDTVVPLTSTQDAINLFGDGSEASICFSQVLAVNQSTPVYVCTVAESSGSKASGSLVAVGTATAAATCRVFVQDQFVDVGIVSGDSASTVATNISNAINSKSHWAVTAAPSSGTVTVTAKQKGLRGNLLRMSARVLNSCGIVVSPGVQTTLTGGTTADDNTNALAAISGSRYYYLVSAAADATPIGALCTQVNSMAAPISGIRQRVVAGSVDTNANAITLATGLNQARAELVWQQNSDWTPGQLAANAAGVYALYEAPSVPRLNFSNFGQDAVTSASWVVPAPLSGTIPTRSQLVSALNNGITPIGVSKGNRTYLVKRITTRSLNGSIPDYRIRDAHKVTVCDRYGDDLVAKQTLQLGGKQIANDPAPGQRVPGPQVATPRTLAALINQLTREYGNNDLLDNVDDIIANTVVIHEASPNTRLSARIPLDVADILDQVATQVNQVG